MNDKVLLTLKDVSVGYRNRVVLRDVSATVNAGELVAVIGSNGAGKSTLLRSIEGSIPLLTGKIEIAGEQTGRMSPRQMAQLVAVVNTQRPDTQRLTTREIVELGRYPHTGFWGRLSQEDKTMVNRAMQLTGTAPFSERCFASLSDGERQKVMIARALAQQTPLILLDEPTSFLDVASRLEVMALLQNLARTEGRTVLMSTHDIPSSLEMADRLWMIFPAGEFGAYLPETLIASYDSDDTNHPLNRLFVDRALAFSPSRLNYIRK